MPATYIYKPATYKGPVFLAPSGTSGTPTITGPNGQIYTGKFINDNEGRRQFSFPREITGLEGLQLNYGGQTTTLGHGGQSYEGAGLNNLQARSKGSIGGGGFSGGGTGNGSPDFTPGQQGQYGFNPAYLGGEFPSPTLINYQPINAADYNFTDPLEYAKKFGEFNRGEINTNFNQSQDLALKTLNTELKGLENFVPAAAALKRSQTSIDNIFNQQQRTQQINQTLPGVTGQLNAQASRAETYASGNIPDSVTNAAYELGIRSNAADQASFGGLGASSSASRKVSDLLSAEDRIKLSQYGDQLLSGNIQQKSSLLLAPTELSNAGQQISVNPEVGAGRLTSQNQSELNANTLINPATALSSQINQNQFTTQLQQGTNQFNASNQLASDQFNANNTNNFALQKFGYDVGFAGTVAGAAQTNSNTEVAFQQQQMYQQIFQQYQSLAQQAQQTQSIFSGIGALVQGLGGFSGITNGVGSLFGGGGNAGGISATAASIFGGAQGGGGGVSGTIGQGVGGAIGGFYGGPAGATIGSQIGAQAGPVIQEVGSSIIDSIGSVS